jgi:hypothetical protein
MAGYKDETPFAPWISDGEFQRMEAEAHADERASQIDEDWRCKQEWLRRAGDMGPREARLLWGQYFPPHRYRPGYLGVKPPAMPDQPAPTPVERPIDSPIYWAGRRPGG